MDFGIFPPEVNSGRMYAGAGPGPLLAAAAAWGGLASELHSAAAGYGVVLADLSGAWHGPSAESMAAAATPYAEWMSSTAAQAELASSQATAAAAAYETAFAATVPPPVIVANRSQLLTLIATNVLGLNTPAIAATEAHYAEMWAQDVAAMYSYAAAAAAATQLSPFAAPPKTTTARAASAPLAAAARAESTSAAANITQQVAQWISAVPNALHGLASNLASSPLGNELGSLSTIMGNLTGAYSPVGWAANTGTGWLSSMQILGLAQNVPGVVSLLNGPAPITGALGPLSGGYVSWQAPAVGSIGAGAVSANVGHAGLVGSLSVPSSWAANAPALKTLPVSLSSSSVANAASTIAVDSSSPLFSEMALSSLAGRAVGGTAVRSVAGGGIRVIDKAPDTEALTTATILVIPVGEESLA